MGTGRIAEQPPLETTLAPVLRGCDPAGFERRHQGDGAVRSDPEEHAEAVQEYVDAGFDHVVIHHIGSNQAKIVEYYEEAVFLYIED